MNPTCIYSTEWASEFVRLMKRPIATAFRLIGGLDPEFADAYCPAQDQSGENEEARYAIWNGLRNMCRSIRASGSDQDIDDHMLLAIWLGLYFNKTPYPELWQTIADRMDRSGGAISAAFTLAAYGIVYRIERRRWNSYERYGIFDQLDGIVTVVDESVLVKPQTATLVAGDSRSSSWEPDVSKEPTRGLREMAERLARLYCSYQVLRYVGDNRPMQALHIAGSDGGGKSRGLMKSPNQVLCVISTTDAQTYWSQIDSKDKPAIQRCVIGSREGVARDLQVLLGNAYERSVFSVSHSRLRDVTKRVVGLALGARRSEFRVADFRR